MQRSTRTGQGTIHLGRIVILGAILAVAGCADRQKGVLVPFTGQAVPGTSKVEMVVATTRTPLPGNAGEMFSGERGATLSFADMVISIPPEDQRVVGEVQWPRRLPGDPAREFVATRSDIVDRDAAYKRFTELLVRPGVKGRALIFVHGYNSRFEDAVMRFAQITHDSGVSMAPVLFTWPSRGRLLAYTYDRESANYSRDALASVLTVLAADKRVAEIGILAHSMGNWVTLEALRTLALKNGRIPSKIHNVMLAAPDVDVDVFRTQLASIGKGGPKLTMFVSRDDKALNLSANIWGNVPRVGAVDPKSEPYRTTFEKAGLTVVDLTDLKTGDKLAHGKFAESPDVVRFIGTRLAAGQEINEQRSGLGEKLVSVTSSAGASLGRIAGQVVSAPAAILDGDLRPTIGNLEE